MKGRTLFITLVMATILVALSAGAAGGSVQPNTDRQAAPPGPEWLLAQAGGLPIRQIMIKFSSDLAEADLAGGAESAMLATLSRAAGEELTYVRPMSGGAHVLAIREARSPKVMAELSARLDALPEVEYAEPDLIKTIDRGETEVPQAAALVPNDPRYSDQWHYGYAAGTSEGLNLPPAWSITTGSPSTVVAVLDTGILFGHPDLAGRTVAGYDMISNTFVANDGNGRDTDPSDPGDWTLKDECPLGNDPRNSSWHGTHVAGTIGAASNNGVGVTGVNWQAKILPVRVLGKCGGDTSDIIDAVRWAAGIHVTGVPDNPNPADVINLSLGGPGACLASEQSAFDDAVAAGATVVVAAGNNSANAINFSPGNCNNIITVAATDRWGDMAWYSNYGSVVEVSAPGGETSPTKSNGILSTLNAGTTSPGAHIYEYYQGTSMATPHVAGLASLIKGLKPSFSQAQVLQVLQDNARPFPAGSTCDTSNCGAGIVDAFASVFAVAPHDLDEVSYLPLLQTPALAAKVSFGSSNFSAGEGDGQAMLIVKLNRPVGQAVSVGYSTSNGSASAGSDYVQKNAMITFSPGQISKNIAVTLLEDTKPEAAETFLVTLHTPSGAAIGSPGQATVTIWDNDQDVSVPNGDFEQGSTVWAEYSQQGWQLIVPESYLPPYASPRSGQYVAWLAGDDDEISYIQQSLTIPAGAPFLTYYHWIYSEDECGHDAAGVVVNGSEVADAYDLCWSENTGGWVKYSADLSDWAGQTVAVAIIAVTNESGLSDLFVDDVSFAGSPAPPVEANPVASVPAQQIGKRP